MQRRIRLIGAVAVAALTAFTACTPPPQPRPPLPTPYTGGTNPDLAPQAGDAAYVEPGPYVAGVTTVEIEPGRQAEVWYPAAPASAAGVSKDVYRIRSFLSPFLQFLLPPRVR